MARTRKVLVMAVCAAISLLVSTGSTLAATSGAGDVTGLLANILGVDTDPGQAERGFLEVINAERAAAGLGTLTLDTQLSAVARDHSDEMASAGTIFHNLDLGKVVTGAWKMLGENVGVGGSVATLHKAFMASPKHRENVLGTYDRAGLGVVLKGSTIYVTEVFWLSKTPGATAAVSAPASAKPLVVNATARPNGKGYWMVRTDGEVLVTGDAANLGSLAGKPLAKPIVGIAATPSGKGYWMVASDGGVFSFGDAKFFGSTGNIKLNKPIVGMSSTPSGNGYWMVAADGGIFSFGDAKFMGSTGAIKLNKPIVGMTASGKGYWMVASDGGIFAFGDARFMGSTGNLKLAKPIVGMAPSLSGSGYWLVAADGGIFAFGDASFLGSAGGSALDMPMVAMVRLPSGKGYWLVGADGNVVARGEAAA
jgi:ribosomal protein L24E